MFDVETNKETFIKILRSIKREGSHIEDFIKYLSDYKFFTAPASMKHVGCYDGGLCEHSLNVYYTLKILNESLGCNVDDDSIKILGLLHDVGKLGLYSPILKDEKVYNEDGSYTWEKKTSYIKHPRGFVSLGSTGENSEYLIRCFIPLSYNETCALYHSKGQFDASQSINLPMLMNECKELNLLISAESLATYLS